MYKKKEKIESKLDMKQISLRLRSEFNDLKRTPSSVSKELNFPKNTNSETISPSLKNFCCALLKNVIVIDRELKYSQFI